MNPYPYHNRFHQQNQHNQYNQIKLSSKKIMNNSHKQLSTNSIKNDINFIDSFKTFDTKNTKTMKQKRFFYNIAANNSQYNKKEQFNTGILGIIAKKYNKFDKVINIDTLIK